MMVKLKSSFCKIVAAITLVCVAFSCAACANGSGNNETDDPSTIVLDYYKTGLGIEFLNKIIDAFEKEYPQYNVALSYSSKSGKLQDTITLGADYNPIDLYMSQALTSDYNRYIEPLDDILTSAWKNEEMTIGEKYNQTYLSGMKSSEDEHYYYLSYGGGYVGLVYNASIIDGVKYTVPNTTDELVALAMRLDAVGQKTFISFNNNAGYWTYHDEIWQAQYDGLDYVMNNFWKLTDSTGNSPSKDVFQTKDGRYEVLKLQEKLQNNAYIEASSFQDDFSAAQTKFLNGKGAIMVSGTWLRNEMDMNAATQSKFKMMRTPVLSSLRNKCDTIGSDKELSALVSAIDAASSLEEISLTGAGYEVSAEDLKLVYDARNLVYCTYNETAFIIPEYSNCKEGAKEFIRFFYSDAMTDVYEDTLKMPAVVNRSNGAERDLTGWSEWDKMMITYLEENTPIFRIKNDQSKMFSLGGLSPYCVSNYKFLFAAPNANDRKKAETIWNDMMLWTDENWDDCLVKAGLN